MDARLKETMINLVKNNTPEEIVGFIMTQITKVSLLEKKVAELQAESAFLEKNVNIPAERN